MFINISNFFLEDIEMEVIILLGDIEMEMILRKLNYLYKIIISI